jgi:hypothetical protein
MKTAEWRPVPEAYRMSGPAFQAWIEDARRVRVQDELARRGLWSRAMHGDNGVPCPGCGGRDRFAVNVRKNVWNCRASGTGGDAIELVRHIDGADFLKAVEIVTGRPPPDRGSRISPAERRPIGERAAAAHAGGEARLAAKAKEEAYYREEERKRAWRIWQGATAAAWETAKEYLHRRAIAAPVNARLRCHGDLAYFDRPKFQGGKIIHRGPAMLAAIEGPDGRFAGVHQTWIDLCQPDGKARIIHPGSGEVFPARKVRGSVKGGTVFLARGGEPSRLFLGEGIETVLSVYCELLEARHALLDGAEFRSALSLGNLAGKAAGRVRHPTEKRPGKNGVQRPVFVPDGEPLDDSSFPVIRVPDSVRELFLLGDGDSEPFFTRMAMERAARRFAYAYPWLTVKLCSPSRGHDYNDDRRAQKIEAA